MATLLERRRPVARPANLKERLAETVRVIDDSAGRGDPVPAPSPAALQLYLLEDPELYRAGDYVDRPTDTRERRAATVRALDVAARALGESSSTPSRLAVIAPNVYAVLLYQLVFSLRALVRGDELTHARLSAVAALWESSPAGQSPLRQLRARENDLVEFLRATRDSPDPVRAAKIEGEIAAELVPQLGAALAATRAPVVKPEPVPTRAESDVREEEAVPELADDEE